MSHTALRPQTKIQPQNSLADEQLEALQHFIELGRLSASLLHEISGPLTAAILYLDQVDEQHDSINVRQARRSLSSLRKYVEAARQQIDHNDHELSSFCIYAQIEQVKRLVLPLARAEGVSLIFEDILHYQLYGEPVKFQQVIANLIINAIDAYNHKAGKLIKPVKVAMVGTDNSITITVSDQGEGIASEQLQRVFEPFYTTKSSNKHGLGIGLTIVKEHITRSFHGSINASSSPRSGTQFVLCLPALPSPPQHLRKKR
jgi:signal transduction histidine kinase